MYVPVYMHIYIYICMYILYVPETIHGKDFWTKTLMAGGGVWMLLGQLLGLHGLGRVWKFGVMVPAFTSIKGMLCVRHTNEPNNWIRKDCKAHFLRHAAASQACTSGTS